MKNIIPKKQKSALVFIYLSTIALAFIPIALSIYLFEEYALSLFLIVPFFCRYLLGVLF